MNPIVSIICGIIIILAAIFLDDGENFTSRIKEQFTSIYKPRQNIPPGYTDINVMHKNSKTGIPIINKSEYCNDNPECYPCPNWKYMGNPRCPSHSTDE